MVLWQFQYKPQSLVMAGIGCQMTGLKNTYHW